MKTLFFIFALVSSLSIRAQVVEALGLAALTVGGTAVSVSISLSNLDTGMGPRGVAALEQLRDEMPALQLDLLNGDVSNVEQVRQHSLKELFSFIEQNDVLMNEVRSKFPDETNLDALVLFMTEKLYSLKI